MCVCCLFSGQCRCHLLATPSHLMVGVGSDANFTCQSSIPYGISWYFKALGGHSRLLSDRPTSDNEWLTTDAYLSIDYSSDGRSCRLHLRHVDKQLTGTFKCTDKDAAAFADLTVVGKSISLHCVSKMHQLCNGVYRWIDFDNI